MYLCILRFMFWYRISRKGYFDNYYGMNPVLVLQLLLQPRSRLIAKLQFHIYTLFDLLLLIQSTMFSH